MSADKAIIIGAGPAGLTAAYELQKHTALKPIVLEMTGEIGGISRTVNYKGNRMDIGGHRFFSKSQKVMEWWQDILPLENEAQTKSCGPSDSPSDASTASSSRDLAMLVRNRISRIYYLRKFFNYPVSLNLNTILNLGLNRTAQIGLSYARRSLFPIKDERSLEDFFINRFGDKLYKTFFKDYTEKVWGVPCSEIGADWGAQRIKGLSVRKALAHAIKGALSSGKSIAQKNVETSLIERFLYPKLGPGQLWEETASRIRQKGGEVLLHHKAVGAETKENRVVSVTALDPDGKEKVFSGDCFFSTMPVRDLVQGLCPSAPAEVRTVSDGLMYRDFITVGLLVNKLKVDSSRKTAGKIKDNWIYIQEPEVKLGRLQVFNNWSPFMVKDPDKVWLGLEYFCNEHDELWEMPEEDFAAFAIKELAQIDIIDESDVIDSAVIKVPKAYPGYFGTYKQFDTVRKYMDSFQNLYLIGRNGMHRYNNQDHSMLAAMTAVKNIKENILDKSGVWSVNTEDDYHEEK